ncbi:hypothetical protein CEXT_82391 [Caerostris extrusa]|uniref:Uncharacterized protein n=1 Tax=Caerostris extrusa TaxID=172846 RepID=A0AAV4MEJ9_CAEEX|nr:hypothetical protein CEXT_82391 [Caerostris extrusa]
MSRKSPVALSLRTAFRSPLTVMPSQKHTTTRALGYFCRLRMTWSKTKSSAWLSRSQRRRCRCPPRGPASRTRPCRCRRSCLPEHQKHC